MAHRTRTALSALAVVIALLALVTACDRIERTVTVTPGAVPEQLKGARWQSTPVSYCLVDAGAGFVDATRFAALVQAAFDQWGVQVTREDDCDAAEQGNGRNEITWGRPPEADGLVHEAGSTQLLYRSCPGECEGGAEMRVVEADIVVHPEPPGAFENEDCLLSTLLHETGHFFGVPHLESPAVMAPATSTCPTELTPADREEIEALYARG